MEMSSSSAGQWIPRPGPINSHRCRSLGDPCARRGYHCRGTETVRPSSSSTISARAVTCTAFAVTASVVALEVVMPRLQQFGLVLLNETLDSVQLVR